jgi:type IV secretion system protein VirD4
MKMVSVGTLMNKLIHTWPVLFLVVNWYVTQPLLINFIEHDTSICVKYILTGFIPFIFSLLVIKGKYGSNRIWINLILLIALGFALCQLYFMGWNIAQIPWPELKVRYISLYFEMITRLNHLYILCSVLPVLVIVKLIQVVNQKLPKSAQDLPDTHGSARFATLSEIKKLNCKQGIPIGLIPQTNTVTPPQDYIASIKRQTKGDILRLDPVHVVLIAPSGSGKGVGLVIPALLDYEGPVFVTDVKSAENFYVTAAHRRSMGRKVYAFDPEKVTNEPSVAINILDYFDPEREEIVTDLANLASLICPIPLAGDEKDIHFAELAHSLIHCFLMYVVCSEVFPHPQKHLKTLYEFFCLDPKLFGNLLHTIYTNKTLCYGVPARLAGSFMSIDEREWSGVFTTGQRHLRFTDSPMMERVLNHSSIDVRDVLDNKADLFVCISTQSLKTQSRMLKLLLTSLFVFIRNYAKKPEVPLLMVLDELPIIGNIAGLEDIFLAGRGYGVKVMAVAQSIQMLKTIYPDSWETILGSNLSVFINPSDLSTKEYISHSIGQMTVATTSESKGESGEKSPFIRSARSENEGESIQHTSRAVLTPDEVGLLGKNVVVAFLQGACPLLLPRLSYFDHKHWRGKYGPNPLEPKSQKKSTWW